MKGQVKGKRFRRDKKEKNSLKWTLKGFPNSNPTNFLFAVLFFFINFKQFLGLCNYLINVFLSYLGLDG